MRHKTKEIQIGKVTIGGTNPIAIQSMTNTKTEDVKATVSQILQLEKAGCEIIRCAIPTMEAAKSLEEIKNRFTFLWWRTFILITALPLQRWNTVQIK